MEKAKFRAHHLFCRRFLKVELPDRGEALARAERRMLDLFEAGEEVEVEVCEGVDELCRACPECQGDRCRSAQGEEEAVRKWDSIILKGLGVSYGETRTSRGWRTLIEEKAPLKFCQTRCPWKGRCSVAILGERDKD